MKKYLLLLTTVLALSCSSDEGGADSASLKLITGITLRQNPEDAPLELGNPNVLVNGKFVIYPNPAINSVFITSEETVTDVWIVKGNAKKIHQQVDYGSILTNSTYSEETIVPLAEFSLNGQSSNEYSLDISNLQKGYYRVFAKIGGKIYWDNLYKLNEQQDHEAQLNSIFNFWD